MEYSRNIHDLPLLSLITTEGRKAVEKQVRNSIEKVFEGKYHKFSQIDDQNSDLHKSLSEKNFQPYLSGLEIYMKNAGLKDSIYTTNR